VSIQHPYGLLPAAFVSRKATHFAQSVQTVSKLCYRIRAQCKKKQSRNTPSRSTTELFMFCARYTD